MTDDQQPEPTVGDVIAALGAMEGRLNRRLDHVDRRLDHVEGKADAALGAVETLARAQNVGFTGLSARVDQVGAHVSEVHGAVVQLREDLAYLKAAQGIYEQYQADTSEAVRRIGDRLRQHEQDPDAHGQAAA